MAVTREERAFVASTFSNSFVVPLATTPVAGDVVIAIAVSTSAARSISSVSGLGATWAVGFQGTHIGFWIGTGATASGNATVGMNGFTDGAVILYLVRGLTSTTVTGNQTSGSTNPLAGPSLTADSGQLAIYAGAADAVVTFPSATTPGSGWTSAMGVSGKWGDAYRVPSSSDTHHADMSGVANKRIGGLVIGDVATDASVTLAGTLQTLTGAFTAATVLAASLAGTLQEPTAAFELSASAQVSLAGEVLTPTAAFAVTVEDPSADVSLAAELQAMTAEFSLDTELDASLAGELQPLAGAFSLTAEAAAASVSLDATLQAMSGDFSVSTADRTVSMAATLRRDTAAFTVVSQPAIRLAAELREMTAEFSVTTTPTVVLAGSLQPMIATFITYAVTPVEPAPLLARGYSEVVAQAFGAVTMNGTQPVYSISQASTERARQRILVDGVDVSYFRDAITPNATYTLLEPLLYGPGQIDFPQISAAFEQVGVGALSWLRPGANVEVQRVLDDVVVATDYKGVIVAFDKSGRSLSVELGGEASGRAALRDRQMVIFPRVNDLGHQIADAVRDLGLPHYPALGTVTGIETMTTGGVGHLEHIQGLVAKAWTRAGKHWTVMPDEATGVYETHQKDETTVHATAFTDDARTVATLRRDVSEEPNRIFITGVTPSGLRVRFGVYPGLKQGDPPPFPGHLQNGDTGEGVRLLIGRLQGVGYLKLEDVSGGYDFDVISAVEALQFDAKLAITGEVNEATWNALYDLDITTPSLVGAHIEPAAQLDVVREKIRSGSGIVIGFNDDYDPEVLVSDRTIDAGVGKTRGQLREFALAVLAAADSPNWVGDIKFHTGALLHGDVAIGATIAEADVMDARALRPGMNMRLPQFEGGILPHVVACEPDDDGIVTATVDTRFRDAMDVWAMMDRDRESRNDPARRRKQKHRSSTIAKDSIGEADEFHGRLWQDVHLIAGWNVFQVIMAMEGVVSRFRWTLATPAEHAVAVFGKAVDRGFMDDTIGLPLTSEGERNWRRKRAEMKDRDLLVSFGTEDEPCGYGADVKFHGAALTGGLDEGDFPYRSETRTEIYVAVWVEEENTIPLGRIMWAQLEAGA